MTLYSTRISTERLTTDLYSTKTITHQLPAHTTTKVSTVRETLTHQLPAHTTTSVSTDRITYTSYASGSAPATVSRSVEYHAFETHANYTP